MKKICFIAVITLLGTHTLLAQQSTTRPTEQAKTALQKTMANADFSAIFLKKITVTDTQKPQVNKIIADYLGAKRTLGLAARKNPAIYPQQQPALFNTFKTNLSAVLSAEQMNTFLASKPAADDKGNLLRALFY
ncbi:hypothetical protein [Chitinophaga sp.]|uniref:hypothetical protein n=1 Tax=Chitinophaga sp. TaxID=1869181 RepID=UPI002F959CA7